mmetsp:Transcript_49389/g.152594  ORF Transcript_49389/g.152594 Transcript_49389/m.152594 type:complete len:182 (-) Transcript_49389:1409-1954(-)
MLLQRALPMWKTVRAPVLATGPPAQHPVAGLQEQAVVLASVLVLALALALALRRFRTGMPARRMSATPMSVLDRQTRPEAAGPPVRVLVPGIVRLAVVARETTVRAAASGRDLQVQMRAANLRRPEAVEWRLHALVGACRRVWRAVLRAQGPRVQRHAAGCPLAAAGQRWPWSAVMVPPAA